VVQVGEPLPLAKTPLPAKWDRSASPSVPSSYAPQMRIARAVGTLPVKPFQPRYLSFPGDSVVRMTVTLTGRSERMRASGPVERDVRSVVSGKPSYPQPLASGQAIC